jgi:Do/DeqQ family serine protease
MAKRLVLSALLILTGFTAGLVLTGRLQVSQESLALPQPAQRADTPTPQAVAVQGPDAPRPTGLVTTPDFSDVAARTVGAVVNISAVQMTRTFDPFAGFFGSDSSMYGYRRGQSTGSGVLVSADGYILTNNHVVDAQMQEITVILSDRRERPAKLIAVDRATDLAVLKIEGRNLPTIPWGDSSHLRVAEWVLAIGNPYQLSSTVTLGIVSALGRTNINVADYEDFIQTDAAINPGNSGGALINTRGELIGINTAIFSESGGYQGIGFAVPSNLVRRVFDDLVKFGEVRRGSVGAMRLVAMTPQLAEELNLRNTTGLLVWQISRDASGYEAGLRPGDVIVSLNNSEVTDASQFQRQVADTAIGTTVSLKVMRDGRSVSLTVPVEKAQAQAARRRR